MRRGGNMELIMKRRIGRALCTLNEETNGVEVRCKECKACKGTR